MQQVQYHDLGLIDFKEAWEYQEQLLKTIVDCKMEKRGGPSESGVPCGHHLLFCEHPHVFTLGKSGKDEHLLLDEAGLDNKQAGVYRINRGGDITYHGPGQLVGYPIFDLDHFFNDIHKYLRFLEEAVIRTLAFYGIPAGRIEKLTGVWVDCDKPHRARKICAMGVRCSRWVTMHGLALNVNTDLTYFNNIIPCGISDKAVTSMQSELGAPVNLEDVKEKLLHELAEVFGFRITFGNKLPTG